MIIIVDPSTHKEDHHHHHRSSPIVHRQSTMAAASAARFRQPCYFLAHGSPMWIVSPEDNGPRALAALGKKILASGPNRPKSLLVVSAHWETDNGLKITTAAKHDLLYDYYGFPPEFYDVKYPADGDPLLADRASRLLKGAGFRVSEEKSRGLDHGVFTPLLYLFPGCEIPVVQLSLPVTRDPNDYFMIGKALAPLRDEGVLILGLGFILHNLRELFRAMRSGKPSGPPPDWTTDFANRVRAAILESRTGEELQKALLATYDAPSYRMAAPSPEHYAPVLFAAGAGSEDKGTLVIDGWESLSSLFTNDSYRFGDDY
ncbi:Extradiol ring-cleavage dioxygenase, class III enzyme, subunit B [Zopfochytrium polystomum]|nr:Extradiol ring-cleavage dioxygenase, class III enzyme, subunit B [Zopfochytrium polystomum]